MRFWLSSFVASELASDVSFVCHCERQRSNLLFHFMEVNDPSFILPYRGGAVAPSPRGEGWGEVIIIVILSPDKIGTNNLQFPYLACGGISSRPAYLSNIITKCTCSNPHPPQSLSAPPAPSSWSPSLL